METSQTVDRALALIDALENSQGLTIAQLSAALGLHKTIVRRLVVTLELRDYIRRTTDGRYILGLKLIALGRAATDALEIRQVAMPYMAALSKSVGETILLTILDQNEAVCIEKVDPGRQLLRVAALLGRRLPVYRGTSSKVLLAFQDPAYIEEIIAPLPNADELRRQLKRFRTQGYAETYEELDAGTGGVGAPIRDHTGQVIAGLTIVGPLGRVNPERAPALSRAVIAAADAVSHAMGYRQPAEKGESQ